MRKKYYKLSLLHVIFPVCIGVVRFSIWSFGGPRTLCKTSEDSHFAFHQSFFSIIARRLSKTYCYSGENLSCAANKQLHRMSVQCDEQRLEWREVLDQYRHY